MSASTMTSHINRLLAAGAVSQEAQGRHRYCRLADRRLATVYEALAKAAPALPVRSLNQSSRARQLGHARTCYDHLAGEVAVSMTDSLLRNGYLRPDEAGYVLTAAGERALADLDVDVAGCRRRRRRFAYPCLDWTERTHHIGGSLGAGLLATALRRGWVTPQPKSRALTVTQQGKAALAAHFRIG